MLLASYQTCFADFAARFRRFRWHFTLPDLGANLLRSTGRVLHDQTHPTAAKVLLSYVDSTARARATGSHSRTTEQALGTMELTGLLFNNRGGDHSTQLKYTSETQFVEQG